jgi:methylmalonyl-CoA mutase
MADTETADLFSNISRNSARSDWLATVTRALKGADFDKKLVSRTADGLRIEPLYSKADSDGPGPWRGSGATPWRITQRVDHPNPEIARQLALSDLEGGADSLVLVFAGAGSARGYGLVCDDVRALDFALDDVSLEHIHVRIDRAPSGRINAALVAALAARRKHDPASLDIDFGLDPVGTLAQNGMLPAAWPEIAGRLVDSVKTLSGQGFRGPFLCADARPWHEAGASEAQELAATLATLVAYLRVLDKGGIPLDQARRALSCVMVADSDVFLTIAKLRAMRRLWLRVEAACGLSPKPLTIHVETAWRALTRRDPWVNLLRGTLAAFAAGLGGADSINVLPFTSALGLADADARRLARNTQLILLEEANLWRVIDPAAGAGSFEALSDDLCETAWGLFQEIEGAATRNQPGIIAALGTGAFQARIANVRTRRERDIATRKAPITGTSEFPSLSETPVNVLDIPRVGRRTNGNKPHVSTMPFANLLKAISDNAARGDITPAPNGEFKAQPLQGYRAAEPYEALRDSSDAMLARTGRRPSIFIAGLGTLASFTARSGFARNLFEAGGIAALSHDSLAKSDGNTDMAALADAFRRSGAAIACLCGTDEAYISQGSSAAKALAQAGCKRIYLAGRADALGDALANTGITDYVHIGIDVPATLAAAMLMAQSTATETR